MAEGTSAEHDDVVCRFFLTSSCRDGDRCPFSHDSTRSIPDTVCRYYLQGTCAFGEYCRYDHVFVDKYGNSSANSAFDQSCYELMCWTSGISLVDPCYAESCNERTEAENHIDSIDSKRLPKNWIDAPEFIPQRKRSYVEVLKSNTQYEGESEKPSDTELCPFFLNNDCPFGDQCMYVHGDVCELCNNACLHPHDEVQRKAHVVECEKELELNMELSFAVQRSLDKTCGICMDVIVEKEPVTERRFGILEKCNHVFCLTCIRQWRGSMRNQNNERVENALDPGVTRACPECRRASAFITPSSYFVDDEGAKKKLIEEYKVSLCKKPCKYFKKGKGRCPFGNTCFYLHAKPDGTVVELPPPNRRRRQNQDAELDDMDSVTLADFLDYRNVLLDIMLLDDSDDSESEINAVNIGEILGNM